MQDTTVRCTRHLHRMSELVQTLRTAPECDRLRALGSIKELMGILTRQKSTDEGNAHIDVKRANSQLVSQKHACSRENESRMKHLRKKIATATTHDDRLSLEEALQTLENLSVDDECKWDVDIMSHWFNAFKHQKADSDGHVKHLKEKPPAKPVQSTSIAAPPSGDDSAATAAVTVSPLVSRVMQAYDREVILFVDRQLERVETEIESLRKQHVQAYLSDVDNTLSVIGTVAAYIDVAAIKAMVVAARTGSGLGTLVDTVRQQYERDPDKSNREWWNMLIKSVTVLRDFNYKRTTLLSERTKLVVQHMDDHMDALIANARAVATTASTLQNKDTRLYVAGVIDDIVRRLHP